ncbi:unnamed protein product [Cuscuta epithymum]|uniref:Uncharacterized protein n=1 Tax=Cuscuta epithymum TaxID=186058 RepID=A0AAV0D9I3_9ASTE|nr:unnamed protein product [Cuscuta epithymum]CAH9130978.1 unnamed protein product [Cuscuta epithymum]
MNILSALLLFLMIFNGLKSAAQTCSQTAGNFTANSTYAANRALLFSALSSNISSSYGFFMNTTVGRGADKIYGIALCRADSTSETCTKCVNTGTKNLTDVCPNQMEAIVWASEGSVPCIVRYSNRSFFGELEFSPKLLLARTDVFEADEVESVKKIWDPHVSSLIGNASQGTKIKYASGQTNLQSFQTIYAITQCTPDLSHSDCDSCLTRIVSDFQSCCGKNKGGASYNPNCLFRWDLYPFYNSSFTLTAPPPPPMASSPAALLSPPSANSTNSKNRKRRSGTVVYIVVPIAIALLVVVAVVIFRRRKQKSLGIERLVSETKGNNVGAECLQFDLATIRIATNSFSDHNKLGEGGFGPVYKGMLINGEVVAVKRLSRNSKQGEEEFKNEVICVARLQHRNLARLVGFCLEGTERLLIYEFFPNSSLDRVVFDAHKRGRLDWEMRHKIIVGIARGLVYLHEDSQLRIVHRDLKASNILLDENMNPKISDFGMARLFESDDQTGDVTSRIVGTYGYMAPEYAFHGEFSIKSDVYSFGVLLLEIITGQMIQKFRGGEERQDLVNYAWKKWSEGTALDLVDPTMSLFSISTSDILRCIHIALLCVQENVGNRPTMTSVLLMLSSTSFIMPRPSRPAYILESTTHQHRSSSLSATHSNSHSTSPRSNSHVERSSRNDVSISELEPR